MSQYQSGADALNALTGTGESGTKSAEFTSFSSGTTLKVKVIGTEVSDGSGGKKMVGNFIAYYNYGIYKKVSSFVAKNPSKKSPKGYPVENLTPWDKAWKYHADLSEEFQDAHSKEAYKYKPAQKFVLGVIDLDTGKPIAIDLTKKQALAVNGAITKYGKKLNKIAFELSKEGESTNTVVSLTPVLDMDEDLSDKQRANFDKAPTEIDMTQFEGISYEADEDEQIELLIKAGFDVSLIGYNSKANTGEQTDTNSEENGEPIDISDDDLPF